MLTNEPRQKTDVLPFEKRKNGKRPLTRLSKEQISPADTPITIQLIIPASRQKFDLTINRSASIGRADPRNNHHPELDLTTHKGSDNGVSRFHALFKHTTQGLAVVDQNSTNGTNLNGQRLLPEEHYLIQNGDELRIGDLLIHLLIKN